MALPEGDSRVGHSFGLEFDGITIEVITDVSGLKMEQEVVEDEEKGPNGESGIRRLPGRPKAPDITLTRGLTADQSFDKCGAIIVFDFEGNEMKRYKLTNAWPKSLEVSSLKAGDTSVLSEKLVLTCDSIEVE